MRNSFFSTISATTLNDRWILVSIFNDTNADDSYSFIYDTRYESWAQFGNASQGSGELLHNAFKLKFFGKILLADRVLGVTPTALVDLSYTTEALGLLNGDSFTGRHTLKMFSKDAVTPTPTYSQVQYNLVTKGYELEPAGTTRIHEMVLQHGGQIIQTGAAGTVVPTSGVFNLYKDTDTYFFGYTGLNDTTASVALTSTVFPYRISGHATRFNSRININSRVLVSALPLECNSFVVEFRSANTTQDLYHNLGSIWVRYESTRQFRVQD